MEAWNVMDTVVGVGVRGWREARVADRASGRGEVMKKNRDTRNPPQRATGCLAAGESMQGRGGQLVWRRTSEVRLGRGGEEGLVVQACSEVIC